MCVRCAGLNGRADLEQLEGNGPEVHGKHVRAGCVPLHPVLHRQNHRRRKQPAPHQAAFSHSILQLWQTLCSSGILASSFDTCRTHSTKDLMTRGMEVCRQERHTYSLSARPMLQPMEACLQASIALSYACTVPAHTSPNKKALYPGKQLDKPTLLPDQDW